MAVSYCDDPSQISDIASKDHNRIVGAIAKALAANSVFMNVIGGGTFPNGTSDSQRSVVQMQAAPGDSLAIPTFVCDTEICGLSGHQDLTDTVNFTVQLESFRGRGPNICVKQGYSAFKGSYTTAEDSLKKLIVQYINADIRAQLYLRSASKFVANANFDFNSLFTGGSETDLGVKFAPILPTGPMTFKALHYLARYMREQLFGEWFSTDKGMGHFRFIGGADQVEYFRSEVGVQNTMCCLTSGGYKLGETTLKAYSFEESPAYKGLAFGVDQRPLRFNVYDGAGMPVLINPVIIVSNPAKKTAYAKINPAWTDALYEIGFLFAEGSFERQVPERYVGEGSFRFAPQLHMGELEWFYSMDCNNIWGDFGFHKYQITRAYKPLRPQHVIAIAYKRCLADLGLVDCADPVASSFTGADAFATVGVCEEDPCADLT